MPATPNIYDGKDPAELPIYSVAEAAHFLGLPPSTLRSWVKGQKYSVKSGTKTTKPLFKRPRRSDLMSFHNLVEAHVLATITRKHKIKLQKVRSALGYLERKLLVPRPLLSVEFQTDGTSLFLERFGKLVNATEQGQLALAELLAAALTRIERDPHGVPVALYPWRLVNEVTKDAPKPIVIDPRHQFGAPVLADAYVPVSVLVDRWQAGDSLNDIADDFEIAPGSVEDAVRWWTGHGAQQTRQ